MTANSTWLLLLGGVGLAALVILWQRRTGAVVARRLRSLTIGRIEAEPNPHGSFDLVLVYGAADRAEIAAGLRAAGVISSKAVTQFGLLRLALTIGSFAGTIAVLSLLGRYQGLAKIYPIAAAMLCFVLTKTLLRSRIAARQRKLGAELPFALDLLLLMLDSGVGIDHAFRHLAQTDNSGVPELSKTFVGLVDDIQSGMSYENALEKWAENVNVYGSRELASLFRQSLLYGTELSQALRSFVHEFADRRVSMARESIGRKTSQMTVVMILFLMPALFIFLGGPAVTSIISVLNGINK